MGKVSTSYSEASTLQTCLRQWDFKYRRGLRPLSKSMPLRIGSAIDAFLNEWYSPDWYADGVLLGANREQVEAWVWRELNARREGTASHLESANAFMAHAAKTGQTFDRPISEMVGDQLALLESLMTTYVQRWGQDDGAVFVERQLALAAPFRTDTGRASTRYDAGPAFVDGIAYYEGRLVLWEDKTTGRLDRSFRDYMERSAQTRWYAWLLRELGYDVEGIVVNAMRRAVPAMPQPVKDGSRLAKTSMGNATPETILSACKLHGFDPADYAEQIAEAEAAHEKWFWRKAVEVTPRELDQAGRSWRMYAEMKQQVPLDPAPIPNQMRCAGCDYSGICHEESPEQIAAGFTTREQRAEMVAPASSPVDMVGDEDLDPAHAVQF
jgi:hypothetical protein